MGFLANEHNTNIGSGIAACRGGDSSVNLQSGAKTSTDLPVPTKAYAGDGNLLQWQRRAPRVRSETDSDIST
jgi:hypothetical protein